MLSHLHSFCHFCFILKHLNEVPSRMWRWWWCTFVIPLERQRQEDKNSRSLLGASLGFMRIFRLSFSPNFFLFCLLCLRTSSYKNFIALALLTLIILSYHRGRWQASQLCLLLTPSLGHYPVALPSAMFLIISSFERGQASCGGWCLSS